MFLELFSNKIIFAPMLTAISAQLMKLFIHSYRNVRVDWKLIIGMGGMPSTHAATVTSLVTALARYEPKGISSLGFGSSFVFAAIVMYDAAGIRRSAGQQAVIINKVVETIEDSRGHKIMKNNLTEVLGHTPLEVFMGAVFGFLLTWFICFKLDPIL